MKRAFLVAAIIAVLTAFGFAQQQTAPAPKPPAQTPPAAASPADALQSIYQQQDPDAQIKAVDEFVAKYPESDLKPLALMIASEAARGKNDGEKAIVYAERALDSNPGAFLKVNAELTLGNLIAQRTREFDLDREEKLNRATKYANDVVDQLKTMQKPRPDASDEQWAQAKTDMVARSHETLGQVAMVRKNYDTAIAEFKLASDTPNPESTAPIRLGQALVASGKIDEGIAQFDKVIANPNMSAPFKQYTQAERVRALQKKGGAAASPKPATGAAAPASPAPTQPAPAQPAPAPPKP